MINNDSVYICASSDLKIDVAVLESWIREWGCDACDTIDAYTVDCYPQERVIEDHRRKNNSKAFLFCLIRTWGLRYGNMRELMQGRRKIY